MIGTLKLIYVEKRNTENWFGAKVLSLVIKFDILAIILSSLAARIKLLRNT